LEKHVLQVSNITTNMMMPKPIQYQTWHMSFSWSNVRKKYTWSYRKWCSQNFCWSEDRAWVHTHNPQTV